MPFGPVMLTALQSRLLPQTTSWIMRFSSSRLLAWILLLLACVTQYLLVRGIPATAPPFDFVHSYQPLAQRFLDQGVMTLWSDDSIRVAPMGYLWTALFGADPATIRSAHEWLGVLLCLLAFDTARRMHGLSAGLAAAWLVAVSPLIRLWLPLPLTEAPFMLFTAVWWWGLAGCTRKSYAFALAAVVGATLSILTRPVWLYPILLLTLLAGVLWWWRRHALARRMAVVHAAALVLPVLVMAKNAVMFDHAVLASGAGAALYYGQHPLTGGIEPPVIGLAYDEGLVMRELRVDHLTPAGDRALKRIGTDFLLSRPIGESLSEMPGRIGRVLFFSNRDLEAGPINERALRIAELLFAFAGLWAARRQPLAWLLGAGIAAQTMQLSLLLYTQRYSVGTLEYPLLLLGGVGAAAALRVVSQGLHRRRDGSRADPQPLPAAVLAVGPIVLALLATGAIAAGYWVQRFVPVEQARIPNHGDYTRALPAEFPPAVWSPGAGAYRADQESQADSGRRLLVRVRVADPKPVFGANDLWRLRMSIVPPDARRCRKAAASFATLPTGESGAEVAFLVRDDGQPHDYVLGANAMTSALYPRGDGELRLTFYCPAGTRVRVQEAVLHESRLPEIYAPLVARLAKELK